MGAEPPSNDVERLSEATLHSHRAGYEAAKWGGTGKNYKKARATYLETLKIHGLKEEYDYIIGGRRDPPNRSEMVPMELGDEGETAVNQGGGDTSLGCRQVSWEEQVQAEEEQRSKDNPKRNLPPPPPWSLTSASITMPLVAPSTSDDGFITIQGQKSQDKRPRDPSKDPTPWRRPSKASWSPLPFPLKSEAERVASVHTLFKAAIGQNRPLSVWVYDRLKKFFPRKTKEQLVYFSNVLCISLSEFHLTSACSPPSTCAPVLPPVVEAKLPPLENYLHEEELESQDIRVCCVTAIKWLGVWLHQVDMTTRYDKARANSPCSHDHKLGALLDFLLILENTGVGLRHIINQAVAENVDALKMCLVKSRKLLKEASKTQTRLLTHLMKQKMTLEKVHLSKKAWGETREALSLTTAQLDQARTTIAQHTADIAHIESVLEDCESTDGESSSLEESAASEPGVDNNPPATTPQDHEDENPPEDPHDIIMRDVGDDPNPFPPPEQGDDLLPVPVTQSDSPSKNEKDNDDTKDNPDVFIEDERIIIETGGATTITPAKDRLLDDQGGTRAETPSGVVTESLSQMNMGSPTTQPEVSDPPEESQDAWMEPQAPTKRTFFFYSIILRVTQTLYGGRSFPPPASWKKRKRRGTEPGAIMTTPCTELF